MCEESLVITALNIETVPGLGNSGVYLVLK